MSPLRLASARTALGWSINELARRAHVAPSTILRAERTHTLRSATAVRLAEALGCTVGWLLGEGTP